MAHRALDRPSTERSPDDREPPRRRRWVRRAVLLLVALFVLALIISVPAGLGAATHLLDGRDQLVAGRTALTEGDAERAAEAFGRALESFEGARGDLGNPAVRFLSWIPLLGRTPDTVTAVADSGALVARAGLELTDAAEDLPGGASALAPRNGRIPLRPMEAVAPALGRARDLVVEADEIMAGSPDSLLFPLLGGPRAEYAAELTEVRGTVEAAAGLSEVLPTFLGADGTKRYFVGAQNPAELRGTGGFIGAYSILTVTNGRMELGPFRNIGGLPREEIEPPTPSFEERYERFGSLRGWHNINASPDVPSVATAIERMYEAAEGVSLDGVILADPQALADLMAATGPVPVPGSDITVDAETVVPFVSNEAYSVFTDQGKRKRVLGEVAGEVLGRFLTGASDPAAGGLALVEAAGGGHLLLHSTDPEIQQVFDESGVAGPLLDPPGDFLAVSMNNAAANKADFYLNRSIRHRVELAGGGRARTTTRLVFRNEAPRRGQPAYVIGPHGDVSEAGQSISITSVYGPSGATLDGFRRDGEPAGVEIGSELGHPVGLTLVDLPSGGSARLDVDWSVPHAWEGDSTAGTYRFTFQEHPTLNPARMTVEIVVPDGMEVASTTPGMEVREGVVLWEGEAEDLLELEVTFRPPFLGRMWREVWEFLNRPLF